MTVSFNLVLGSSGLALGDWVAAFWKLILNISDRLLMGTLLYLLAISSYVFLLPWLLCMAIPRLGLARWMVPITKPWMICLTLPLSVRLMTGGRAMLSFMLCVLVIG